MKNCAFCGVSFQSVPRSKEHVLKRSWLEKYGLLKHPLVLGFEDRGSIGKLRYRSMAANALMAGAVCKTCNNGWMDNLDRAVEPVVFQEVAGGAIVEHLSLNDRMTLGRWIFKVACCLDLTDSEHRRRIHPSVYRQLKDPSFLPQGFVAFLARRDTPSTDFGVSICDRWDIRTVNQHPHPTVVSMVNNLTNRSRIKFGIEFMRVVFGCAYISIPEPKFILKNWMHVPIGLNGASLSWEDLPEPDSVDLNFIKSGSTLVPHMVSVEF